MNRNQFDEFMDDNTQQSVKSAVVGFAAREQAVRSKLVQESGMNPASVDSKQFRYTVRWTGLEIALFYTDVDRKPKIIKGTVGWLW